MKNVIKKLIICMVLLVIIPTSFSLVSLSIQGINREVEDSSDSITDLSTQDVFWPTNSSEWTEVAPEVQGLDSDKISDMFEYIEEVSYDLHSVIITRNGYLLTEEYLYNSKLRDTKTYSLSSPFVVNDTLHEQHSTTKSLMALLIGIAIEEGYLNNLSQTLYEFFADIWKPSFTNSTLKKNITIEQLLTHNAGFIGTFNGNYPGGDGLADHDDCVKWALDNVTLVFTPGEEGGFAYNNDGVNLLSGIISNVTGKNAADFAREHLLEPMGITEAEWEWSPDKNNITYGAHGFWCSPRVQAKLGILCLNNGTWNGTQLIPSDWVINATSFKTPGRWVYFPSTNSFNYGYLFYTDDPHDGYHTYGSGGQNIYVIPEYNVTVSFTGFLLANAQYQILLNNYILQFAEDNAPEWDQIPDDQQILEGESFIYDINASDTSGVQYWINDTTNFDITLSEGIITNIINLTNGVYSLEIRAYNPFNNNISVTINIEVKKPNIPGIPGFDLNMILLIVSCTSAIILISKKKIFKDL
ncbi:MAG: serine hydrolase domain-containing protein [Promethearchaeota archaeon]